MDWVYSANEGIVAWGPPGASLMMRLDDVWCADDPFVIARPDLFSSTPLAPHATDGRPAPPATSLPPTKKRRP